MRTLFLLASIVWALNAPLPFLLKAYLRAFLFLTCVLELMLLVPAMDNYSRAYAVVYWCVAGFLNVFQPGVIIWCKRGRMLTCTKFRILAVAWMFMAIYYVGYFRDPHSDRFDWLPTAIYGTAFICLGAVARATASRRIPDQLPST